MISQNRAKAGDPLPNVPSIDQMPEFNPSVLTDLTSSSDTDPNPITNPPLPTRGIRYATAQPPSQASTFSSYEEAVAYNFATMRRAVEIAAGYYTQLITFTELFMSGYEFGELDPDNPDPDNDAQIIETVRQTAVHLENNYYQPGGPIANLAIQYNMTIVATGPMDTTDPSGKAGIYDGAVIFEAGTGQVLGRVFKTHLWGFSERNWFSVAEFDTSDPILASRQAFPVFTANEFPFSVGVCFDADFPEASRCMSLNGSLLNCFPTASPTTILPGQIEPYPDIREHHIPTNAMQNQCFCSYGNRARYEYVRNDQTGKYDPVLEYDGNSVICSPYGRQMAASLNKDQFLLIADCVICDFPSTQPPGVNYMTNRRPEIYGLLTAQTVPFPFGTPSGYTYANPVPPNQEPELPSEETPISCVIDKKT